MRKYGITKEANLKHEGIKGHEGKRLAIKRKRNIEAFFSLRLCPIGMPLAREKKKEEAVGKESSRQRENRLRKSAKSAENKSLGRVEKREVGTVNDGN